MGTKIIVKSGYIRNQTHQENVLRYAGNKIEAQLAVLEDGSTVELGARDRLEPEEQVSKVQLTLENGWVVSLTPERYQRKIWEQTRVCREQEIRWDGETNRNFSAKGYLKYIAHRPSVEKIQDCTHGLFNLNGASDLEAELERLRRYENNVMWSHIISLEREDAQRMGFDNRAAWETLVRAKAPEIARIYNISLKNLVVNAAYHDKDHHPHLHLYFYSTDPKEGIVKSPQAASAHLKSLFFNEIFKEDTAWIKAEKTDRRDQLEERMGQLLREMNKRSYRPPQEVCQKLLELSSRLQDVQGKNVYAYQSQEIKGMVDELVKALIQEDRHLGEIFQHYLDSQWALVSQYQEDPKKIEARMEEFVKDFYHPKPAQRGKPGSGGRAVLHNEVLRFAKTLTEQLFEGELETPQPKPFKKKSKESPEDELRAAVYQSMRDLVQEDKEDLIPLWKSLEQDEFADSYRYASLEAKQEVGKFLEALTEDEEFGEILQRYLESQQRKTEGVSLEELFEKFLRPGKKDPHSIQDSVVRFAKKLEEQRAVILHNRDLFFALTKAAQDPDPESPLLLKIYQLSQTLKGLPPSEIGYKLVDEKIQEQTNALLLEFFQSDGGLGEIPKPVRNRLLNPDKLTPLTFQNTLLRFAKKLEIHQAVTGWKGQLFMALVEAAHSGQESPLWPALERLETALREKPAEKVSYYKVKPETRDEATGILRYLLAEADLPGWIKDELLHPDELTPTSLQNQILRFAARLTLHKEAAEHSQRLYELLSNLEELSPEAMEKLEELAKWLGAQPEDASYQTMENQEEFHKLLKEWLDLVEIEPSEEFEKAMMEPDELTPITLQNQMFRFAARLQENQAIQRIGPNLRKALRNALKNPESPLLERLEHLHELLGRPSEKTRYRDVEETAKKEIQEILEEFFKECPDLSEEMKKALLHPDQLTPDTLQSQVFRFAARLREHQAVQQLSPALYRDFMDMIRSKGIPTKSKRRLERLSQQVKDLPKDTWYRDLEETVKKEIQELLEEFLEGHQEIPAEIRQELLHPDKFSPKTLLESILGFARYLDTYKLEGEWNHPLFLGLLETLERKHPLHQEMMELSHLLKSSPNFSFRELPLEIRERIEKVIEHLLDNPQIDQEKLRDLLSQQDGPMGLQRCVVGFLRQYDVYLKERQKRISRYIASMLARACARSLLGLAGGSSLYHGRGFRKRGPYRNYIREDPREGPMEWEP